MNDDGSFMALTASDEDDVFYFYIKSSSDDSEEEVPPDNDEEESSGSTSSGSSRRVVVNKPVSSNAGPACQPGDKFSTTTGLPCTSVATNPNTQILRTAQLQLVQLLLP